MSDWRTEINTTHSYKGISIFQSESEQSLVKLTDEEFFSIMNFTKSYDFYQTIFMVFIASLQKEGGFDLIKKFSLDLKNASDKEKVYDDYAIKYFVPTVKTFMKYGKEQQGSSSSSIDPFLDALFLLSDKQFYISSKYLNDTNASKDDKDILTKLALSGNLSKFIDDKLINVSDRKIITFQYLKDNMKLYYGSSSSSSSSLPWYKNKMYIAIIVAIILVLVAIGAFLALKKKTNTTSVPNG